MCDSHALHGVWRVFWLAIVAMTMLISAVGQYCLTTAYKLFPLPGLLDGMYFRSKWLRQLFAFHLGFQAEEQSIPVVNKSGDYRTAIPNHSTVKTSVPTVADLIRAQGWGCHEHQSTTRDGYVLGLQRIVAARLDPLLA